MEDHFLILTSYFSTHSPGLCVGVCMHSTHEGRGAALWTQFSSPTTLAITSQILGLHGCAVMPNRLIFTSVSGVAMALLPLEVLTTSVYLLCVSVWVPTCHDTCGVQRTFWIVGVSSLLLPCWFCTELRSQLGGGCLYLSNHLTMHSLELGVE